ncbi:MULTISPECIES: thiamine phosphate synthase [unclassified Shinella]|uniref:thiamine phosphate synthase n=1 Tax=unclassified Shinella TaxID=2643062 RepID=UPI00225D752D|nr:MULTISPECIES: thiamine phosphate synthase [unclassified Shinella]MCO5138909.1 thiamine phosphate synthase [Shinella sp.]MDC7256362.1 thiamine phosphate synthase [Shinella sp. YE25]CAI0339222.1 Thiamin-phosphate pyrophosphorylase [Rhizobiaceae bacterium]CAK7257635.1 Thiamine-phosphate diphosphorylase [Shinella sp. WSC3-e]
MSDAETRCRLVLILPEGEDLSARAAMLEGALKGGDVASVILPQYGLDDGQFQKHAETLVPIVQQAGAAALVAGDTRVAGRAKADGIHVAGGLEELGETIEKFTPKLIVGGGNATDRHRALEIGEVQPDYIFFGKIGGDIKPEAHPKNLALAEWWASMVEIPCIVLGGTDPHSALAAAETGAEFVALDRAVFADPAQAPHVVAAVNALLDEKAPRFEQ